MRKLILGTALLAVIVLVACEEPMAPGAPPTTPTTRTADIEGIKERWSAFLALGSAPPPAQGRAAAVAASTGRGLFPDDAIVDARSYGACDVFDLDLHRYAPMSVIDCVDRTEQEPGHYHVAAVCIGTDKLNPVVVKAVYVRAGDRRRGEDTTTIMATIDGASGSFTYRLGETLYRRDNTTGMMLLNWAESLDRAMYDRVRAAAADGSGALPFSITHAGITDAGSAAIQSSDAEAVAVHTARCNSLEPLPMR